MSFQKNRVAIITNWFPPKSGVAVNRMKAFANYLSQEYEVHVFCDGNESKSELINNTIWVHHTKNVTIFDVIKSSSKDGKVIHKMKTAIRIILSKIIKNPMNSWVKNSVSKIKEVHSNKEFDYVISSYSPKEPHEIALAFKRMFHGVIWVADMRDEMMNNQNISKAEKNRLRIIEKEIALNCQAILSVSKPIVDVFQKNYPSIPSIEIRNGFDFKLDLIQEFHNDKTIKLGYFGTFYGRRKPHNFFLALEKFLSTKRELNLEVHFIGVHKNFEVPESLRSIVTFHSTMPYENAISLMSKMTANLLIEPITNNKGVFTGKIFDYIAVKRPIIATTDKSDVAAELILEMKAGYVASFNDIEEQTLVLEEFYLDFQSNSLKTSSKTDIESLHRKKQIEKLIILLKKLKE